MRSTAVRSEIRTLAATQLDEIGGGYLPAQAVMVIAVGALVGACWDLPLGATKQQAAEKLGMGHLL